MDFSHQDGGQAGTAKDDPYDDERNGFELHSRVDSVCESRRTMRGGGGEDGLDAGGDRTSI